MLILLGKKGRVEDINPNADMKDLTRERIHHLNFKKEAGKIRLNLIRPKFYSKFSFPKEQVNEA